MTPRTPAEWNIDIVVDFLEKGVHESDSFDFKEDLPDTRSEKAKAGLAKDVAAFANSDEGGFLVFGVKDHRSLSSADRLIGIDAAQEFPRAFGDLVIRCTPSVYWDFRREPIMLPNQRVLHVIHIPRSWKAPHAVPGNGGGLIFPKRTNRGNQEMSYEEVRLMFLGYYEKRLKLQLLRTELLFLQDEAQGMLRAAHEGSGGYLVYSFDPHVMETLLTETFSLTVSSQALLGHLYTLRKLARVLSAAFSAIQAKVNLASSSFQSMPANFHVQQHHKFIETPCRQVIDNVTAAIPHLDSLLA